MFGWFKRKPKVVTVDYRLDWPQPMVFVSGPIGDEIIKAIKAESARVYRANRRLT